MSSSEPVGNEQDKRDLCLGVLVAGNARRAWLVAAAIGLRQSAVSQWSTTSRASPIDSRLPTALFNPGVPAAWYWLGQR
jgi:hypothetical protein